MEEIINGLSSFFRPVCPNCHRLSTGVFIRGCARYICKLCYAHFCPVCLRGFNVCDHTHEGMCKIVYQGLQKLQKLAEEV